MVRDIMAQLTQACAAFDIALCGGHTEVTPVVTQPVVIGQMMGVTDKNALFTSADACVGDALILTKGLGIEATAIIARECEEQLREKYDALFLEQAKNYSHASRNFCTKGCTNCNRHRWRTRYARCHRRWCRNCCI